MKKGFIFLLLFFYPFHTYSEEKGNNPFVKFEIIAKKEVEADIINIDLYAEKKAGKFAIASSNCNKLLNKISDSLNKLGIKKSYYKIYDIKSYSIEGLIGKDYVVRGYVNIKLVELSSFMKVIETIQNIDKNIVFRNVEYDIENKGLLKNQLLEIASHIADKQKKEYEKAFNVSLNLLSIEELSPGGLNPEFNIYYDKSFMTYEKFKSYVDIEQVPVKRVFLQLRLKYSIKDPLKK